nr:MAG TPA: hypothetical protein [Caudoviricetes sp.]
MTEYVERKAIMEFPIRKDHCDKEHANKHFIFGVESVLEYVENLPAADVAPVVRCKGCTHYDMGVCLKIYSDGNAHPEAWQSRRPEDFCSYGERKDGGEGDAAD